MYDISVATKFNKRQKQVNNNNKTCIKRRHASKFKAAIFSHFNKMGHQVWAILNFADFYVYHLPSLQGFSAAAAKRAIRSTLAFGAPF